jgi:hypothetical protein
MIQQTSDGSRDEIHDQGSIRADHMYGISNDRLALPIGPLSVGDRLVGCFKIEMNLGNSNYSVTTALTKRDSHLTDNYEWRDGGFVFSVLNTRKPDFAGSVSLETGLTIQHITAVHPPQGEERNP